ncbi:hypothetical protein OROHE_001807 [Orobanche hederae]
MNSEAVLERAGGKKMDKIVLKHCINGTEHLSFLHGPHMSPIETISLPFSGENEIQGNSCCGLFYFNSFNCDVDVEDVNAVIVNLTTKQLKLIPSPISPDTYLSDNGLGYDPETDDYKVVRISFGGGTADVYSLKSDSWKVIPGPGNGEMSSKCGIYLEGRSYWRRFELTPDETDIDDFILAFDFSRETFSRIPFPPSLNAPVSPLPERPGIDLDIKLRIFDCNGFLGAVGFKMIYDYKPRDAKHFELWVYKGGSWERFFSVILFDVGVPLGVSDDRFLFLEGSSSCGHRHLMVYDWIKEELREHDIYVEPPNRFLLLSYVENCNPIN